MSVLQSHENVFQQHPADSSEPAPSASWVLEYRSADQGKPSARVRCVMCSGNVNVPGSAISKRGDVDAAVICSCGWFDYVSLKGWPEAVGEQD